MKNETDKPKLQTETKNIRHDFTGDEKQQLGSDLARAFGALRGVESEFDGIKASYKSKLDRNGSVQDQEQAIITAARREELAKLAREDARAERAAAKSSKGKA